MDQKNSNAPLTHLNTIINIDGFANKHPKTRITIHKFQQTREDNPHLYHVYRFNKKINISKSTTYKNPTKQHI